MDKYEDMYLDSINMLINRIYNETKVDNIVDVGNDKKFNLKILLIFYMILKMARLMILIKKRNMKKA